MVVVVVSRQSKHPGWAHTEPLRSTLRIFANYAPDTRALGQGRGGGGARTRTPRPRARSSTFHSTCCLL